MVAISGDLRFRNPAARSPLPMKSPVEGLFRLDVSASVARGFHSGGHWSRAAGVMFGGKLLMLGLGAMVVFALATMAMLSASDWTRRRYKTTDYSRAAGIGVFVVVLLVLGFALARLV